MRRRLVFALAVCLSFGVTVWGCGDDTSGGGGGGGDDDTAVADAESDGMDDEPDGMEMDAEPDTSDDEDTGEGGMDADTGGGGMDADTVGGTDTTDGGAMDTADGGAMDTADGGATDTAGGGSMDTADGGAMDTAGGDTTGDTGTSDTMTSDMGMDSGDACSPAETGEICDGKDNDCDGQTDECCTTYYKDDDGDSYGETQDDVTSCTQPQGYATQDGDCDDEDAEKYPGNTETCDGKDNDCDGDTDENVKTEYCEDADGDTYGNSSSTKLACSQPIGYVESPCDDCNDMDQNINPGATELCGDGKDNDCDGDTDENCSSTCYFDNDGDDYGVSSNTGNCNSSDYVSKDGDCDDMDDTINPGATEVCDGKDNDCDGDTDECCQQWYEDSDGDGYGNPNVSKEACSQPSGYVADNTDCLDTDADVNPGQTNFFDTTNNAGGWDYNCDNNDEKKWRSTNDVCRQLGTDCASFNGWKGTSVPDCGVDGQYLTGCKKSSSSGGQVSCNAKYSTQTQECR